MEQSTKRTRFEAAVTTWGQLESQPPEIVTEILLRLPLNDLLMMQQVSKSAYAFLVEGNLIERWFDRYMGYNKLTSSWILQRLCQRYDFSVEHVDQNIHVFVSGLMSKDILLRIEDDEKGTLYKELLSIQPVQNARKERGANIWTISIKNTRSGLMLLYNYLYRIMNMHEMVQNTAETRFSPEELDDLYDQPEEEQLQSPDFSLMYELGLSNERVTEWERIHFGPNDRLRKSIMFYLAFEKRFVFVNQKGVVSIILDAAKEYRPNYAFFYIDAKETFFYDRLKRMALVPITEKGPSKPGWVNFWIGGPYKNFISIMYDWMTKGKLRLLDFETQGKRVLAISEKI